MTKSDSLRDEVRRKYAEAAIAVAEGSGCGCGSGACCEGDASEDFGTPVMEVAVHHRSDTGLP